MLSVVHNRGCYTESGFEGHEAVCPALIASIDTLDA